MPKFQIVTPHDAAQCVIAIDEMLAHDPEFQSKVAFGCHCGDHTGYALIDAADEAEARSKLPRTLAKRARVVAVEYFSPEEIRANHERPA